MDKHTKISFLKSAARLVGFLSIIFISVKFGAVMLIWAEILGILEEI